MVVVVVDMAESDEDVEGRGEKGRGKERIGLWRFLKTGEVRWGERPWERFVMGASQSPTRTSSPSSVAPYAISQSLLLYSTCFSVFLLLPRMYRSPYPSQRRLNAIAECGFGLGLGLGEWHLES